MSAAWLTAAPLAADAYAALRRRIIFDCGKWDPQTGDRPTVADYPVVLSAAEWDALARAAEALYAETLALEDALRRTPRLHRALALPWSVHRALAPAREAPPGAGVRVMRFDFHRATTGWCISEVNSDVPGGFIEAGAVATLFAEHYPDLHPPADPAAVLVDELAGQLPPAADVAFIHATAYTDDRQVMAHLARRATARGLRPHLVSPEGVRWTRRAARLAAPPATPLAALVRFFPAEWLPNLSRGSGWRHYFAAGATPQCNPATALLTQSKRVPLVWDELDVALPTWRRLLPETRPLPPAAQLRDGGWVLKPALGRVGEAVGIAGVTAPRDWRQITRWARWSARHWVAQRRFTAVPLPTPRGDVYPCIGVFVIAGRAAGAYGRVAARPLIDDQAQDAAVLVAAAAATRAERSAHAPHTAAVV